MIQVPVTFPIALEEGEIVAVAEAPRGFEPDETIDGGSASSHPASSTSTAPPPPPLLVSLSLVSSSPCPPVIPRNPVAPSLDVQAAWTFKPLGCSGQRHSE